MAYIGFDTSNYTTSVAAYFPQENRIVQKKRLLTVKQGQKGLRQSEAVFQHTVNIGQLCDELFSCENIFIDGVCASATPRLVEGSYMPCFLVGKNTAMCVSAATGAPFSTTSHQHGHIVSALYSSKKLELLKENFIAFHLSGGTTEAVLVQPDNDEVFRTTIIAQSLDLKAGQAVDRIGIMLGLDFPCGKSLEKLALKSNKKFKIKPVLRGFDCSLSGLENKAAAMIKNKELPCDIALFCIEYISQTLDGMTEKITSSYPKLPLVYSGGVMSNSIIKQRFSTKYGAFFADPEFSSDNAAGIAIMAYLKQKQKY